MLKINSWVFLNPFFDVFTECFFCTIVLYTRMVTTPYRVQLFSHYWRDGDASRKTQPADFGIRQMRKREIRVVIKT